MGRIFYGIICLALTAGMSSCVKNNVKFQGVDLSAYGLQFSDQEFMPVMLFLFQNGALDGTGTKVTKDGVAIRSSLYNSNIVEVKQIYGSLEDMQGVYVCSAVSTEGEQDALQTTLQFKSDIGGLEIEDFEYSNGQLTMTVVYPAENAQLYGFYLRPHINGSPTPNWIDCIPEIKVKAGTTENQKVTMSIPATLWTYLEAYEVYPAAGISQGSSNYSLIRLGNPRTLRKGATSLE